MATDLGTDHSALTELFPQPATPEGWEQYMLSEGQLRQFQEKGYLHGVRLLNTDQIAALRDELAEMVQPDHEGREFFYEYHSNESEAEETTLFHALGAWRVRPTFHDSLWNPAFAMAAYQLLGKGVRMFHDQLFSKPAHHGGVVAYANDIKRDLLDVPQALLEAHGAVSSEVARAMALGCQARFGTDWAISITGIAGPGGGSADKPVGLVYMGFATPQGVSVHQEALQGTRDHIRLRAAIIALNRLRMLLQQT